MERSEYINSIHSSSEAMIWKVHEQFKKSRGWERGSRCPQRAKQSFEDKGIPKLERWSLGTSGCFAALGRTRWGQR
jgi:hypothetical protein